MAKYRLVEVNSPKEAERWLRCAETFYKDYPLWVCPLDNDIISVFDRKKNELFEGGDAIRWYVTDEKDVIVGRIAAFYNTNVANGYEQPTGGCGFFECINSQEVANMMFDASREWLVKHNMEAMDGPINFGSRDSWWGVLVDGFQYQPLYGNVYNPPYYKDLFEAYGFQNYFNQNSYLWDEQYDSISEIVFGKALRIASTPGYSIRDINDCKLEDAAENLRIIYNKAWAMFTGVKPMEKEEAQKILNTIRPIIDKDVIYFGYFNDEPIAFFIMIPDINQIIGKFRGKLNLLNKIRLMWDLKVAHKCNRLFGLIFGITPEFQGKGVECAIFRHILHNYVTNGKNRYRSFEFAWIGDFNPIMNRMITKYVCASRHKMHTTYRYLFDRTKEFKRCPSLALKRREVPKTE